MKPLQKHLQIHLSAWEQHSEAQGPIRAGKTGFHDPGGATNDHQSHKCNNQVSGQQPQQGAKWQSNPR